MVIYPATGGIVVVVVVIIELEMKEFIADEEILCDFLISTTNLIGSQYIKEKQ